MALMHAFVDEYGDANVNTGTLGVTNYFIVTAVLIKDNVEGNRDEAERIRKTHFQSGEMKSSLIGTNDQRRIRILEALANIDYKSFSLVVDKREIYKSSGLAFKSSFFKAVNRKLYSRLFGVIPNLALLADEHGSEEFMRQFEKYFRARDVNPDLFSVRSYAFENSKREVFLQVADVISGSLARCIDPLVLSANSGRIAEILGKKCIGIEVWPPQITPLPRLDDAGEQSSPYDPEVRDHCYRKAILYLEENTRKEYADDAERARRETLEFLLLRSSFGDNDRFVSTKEIIRHLADVGIEITQHQVRSSIIAKLRDSGVLLASSSALKGYKLPTKTNDIVEFLSHAMSIIPPMIARVRLARDDLRLATNGELDILGIDGFFELKKLVETQSRIEGVKE